MVGAVAAGHFWFRILTRSSSGIEAALDRENAGATHFAQRVLDAWTERSTKRSRRKTIGVLAGISVVAMVLVLLLLVPNWLENRAQAAPQAQIQHTSGNVDIMDLQGNRRKLVLGMRIEAGDTITTTGQSSATVAWNDGSRIILTRDTSLQWPKGQERQGAVDGGPRCPWRAHGQWIPSPSFSRLNTRASKYLKRNVFSRQADDGRTWTVRSGNARMTGSDGKSVDVSNGECGVANHGSVEVRKGTATPDSWSEDFERGLPDGWQATFIDSDLPEGSRGAVQTKQTKNEDGESCHQLWSYSDWEHGLAVVHADTCLNFVYRFKTADTVQVMTLLRSPIPDSPAYEIQILQPSDVPEDERWWNIPANKWYTVSIPLSRLTNPVSLKRPPESFVATAFNFRAQNHACRLAIDRMWLQRGTSRKIEFKPIELQGDKQ